MRAPAAILSSIVKVATSIVELTLFMRLILQFFSANAQAPFVMWVYLATDPLLKPFEGMFPTAEVSGGFQLEFSALFAMFVYLAIGYLLHEVLVHLMPSGELIEVQAAYPGHVSSNLGTPAQTTQPPQTQQPPAQPPPVLPKPPTPIVPSMPNMPPMPNAPSTPSTLNTPNAPTP